MRNEDNTVIDTVLGGITRTAGMDAIANTANSSLLGGGGMGGAVHRAAGKELLHEYQLLGGCKTERAKITNAYNMGCRYIIHTVGPVRNGGICGEREKLSPCYRNSLLLVLENGVKWITFPLASIGTYHFPVELAAETAIGTARKLVVEHPGELEHVLWVLFDVRTKPVYDTILRKL